MTSQSERTHEIFDVSGGVPVRSWTVGVPFEEKAREQVRRVASLPFVYKWVVVMPDVHAGLGATVGSVIPTSGAVMPSAVGVDIGCGMMAVRTTLRASDMPEDRKPLREAIERAVPHGRTNNGGRGDKGAWGDAPVPVRDAWARLEPGYQAIIAKYPKIDRGSTIEHLGTLGTGNHFIEICVDEVEQVWLMLHSGSRGVGNRIGADFVELAKREARRWFLELPDPDLAYFPEGTELFEDYLHAVTWAQGFRSHESAAYDERDRRGAGERRVAPGVRARGRARQLSPQLRGTRVPLREERARHSKGRGPGAYRRPRDHPRVDGCTFVHHARARERGVVHELQPRRGSRDVAHGREESLHGRRSRSRHG